MNNLMNLIRLSMTALLKYFRKTIKAKLSSKRLPGLMKNVEERRDFFVAKRKLKKTKCYENLNLFFKTRRV